MVLESLTEPILAPFLRLPPFWSIFILSFLLSVLITLIYKVMTNQELMKSLREDMKKHQKEMKQLKNSPEKMMAVQKKVMQKNAKYMMQSFKPMIVTFIPIILIFGWLNSHYAYYPIKPDQEFTTSMFFNEGVSGKAELELPEDITVIGENVKEISEGKAEWKLKGKKGEYIITYKFNGKSYNKEILITDEYRYKKAVKAVNDNSVSTINIEYEKLKPLPFKIFGWKPGWLGTYIIFSLIFSMSLRKLLKLH